MNKYRVAPVGARTYNGVVFDSVAELGRWFYLRSLEKAKKISQLERQVSYELAPGFLHREHGRFQPIRYVADFRYRDEQGIEIVEDVKGFRTPVYRIKLALFLARYPEIRFREIKV